MNIKKYIISKNIKRIKRKTEFHNLKTAKNIGIIYCIKNKSDYENTKEFAKELSEKGINVSTLAYTENPDEIGNLYFGQGNNQFFSEKHITKFGKIKEKCINDFIEKENDILINLCIENNFYTEYIFALSKAKFKVSGIVNCKYSDLNIDIQNDKNQNFLIEQITYYLNTINKA